MPIEKREEDRGVQGLDRSRRDFLAAAGAAVVLRAATRGTAFAEATVQPPDPSGALDYRSAKDLAAMLAARQVSAVELLHRSIARIEALDAGINAVVVRDFDRAHDAAVAADAALARGERRPLLGVPMTVKEAFNVAGLPTTWGVPPFKDWRPDQDAVVVARLKAAGAVILGKTNVPVALNDWQSFNAVYGTTNNPWDRTRTSGGSSGGSAASLAAGYVPLEMGSDLGGSIRVPAHCCGVYGHRPTHGVVPLRGHQFPTGESPSFLDMAVVGPLARTAGDLSLAMDIVSGPDETEAIAYRLALPPARHDDLKSFRVLVIDSHPVVPVASAIRASVDRLAGRLGKAGAKVARSSPLLPDLAMQARVYAKLMIAVAGSVSAPADLQHFDAEAASLPADDDSVMAWALRGILLRSRDWFAVDQVRVHLQRQWRALFREWDVVLCPAMPTPAFPHDHTPDFIARCLDVDGKPFPYLATMLGWPGIAALPDLPATAVPVELTESGLPIGVQIVGPHLEDRTTLAFAELTEREFGGFVPRPLRG